MFVAISGQPIMSILAILTNMAKMAWGNMATNMVQIGFDANSNTNVDH